MPLQDQLDPSDITSSANAIDTQSVVSGEPSIWDDGANLVTKGIPLTVAAAANSFINTPLMVANWFGAGIDYVGIQDEFSDSYNDYYQAHKTGIEAAALIGGSLIPGVLAVKGLSAGVKAAGLMRAGLSTDALTEATGLLSPIRGSVLSDALANIKAGGSLSETLASDKLKMIALGVGEQALQGLVFEAATYATMKASPLLQDDGFEEITKNLMLGALTGGVLGGAVDGYLGVRSLNKAVSTAEQAAFRTYGDIDYVGLNALSGGDKAASIIQSLNNIPLPSAADALGTRVYSAARDTAILEAKKAVQGLVTEGNEDVGAAFFDSLLQQKDAGTLGPQDFVEKLTRLDSLKRVTDIPDTPTGDIFYVNRFAKGTVTDPEQLVSTVAHPNADLSRAYRLAPDAEPLKIANASDPIGLAGFEDVPLWKNATEAFQAGHDIFIRADGSVAVNPDSTNILGRTARPGESRILTNAEEKVYRPTGNLPADSKPLYAAPTYLNLKTGAEMAPKSFNPMTGDITPGITRVIGDMGKPEMTDVGVRAGGKTYLQSTAKVITPATSDVDASAHYWWWSQHGIKAGDEFAPGGARYLNSLSPEAKQLLSDNANLHTPKSFVEDLSNGVGQRSALITPEGRIHTFDKTDKLKLHGDFQDATGAKENTVDISYYKGPQNSVGITLNKNSTAAQIKTAEELASRLKREGVNVRVIKTQVERAASTIDSTNPAVMEQLYRDSLKDPSYAATLERWKNMGVSMEGGLPYSQDALLAAVQDSKNKLIQSVMEDGAASKLSTADIAAKANVPEDYILSNFQGNDAKDFMRPIEEHGQVNTVQLAYKMGNVLTGQDGHFASSLVDLQYRIQEMQTANYAVGAQFMGDDYSKFIINKPASFADIQGVNKGIGPSNAGYGSFGQEVERVGRELGIWINKKIDQMQAMLGAPVAALRDDPVAAQEANIFTHIRRRTSEAYTFLPADLAERYKVSPDTAVIKSSLVRDKAGNVIDWNVNHTPAGFISNQAKYWEAGSRDIMGTGATAKYPMQIMDALHTSYELSPKVAAFERASQQLNDVRNMAQNRFYRAQGLKTELPVGDLYAPPINPEKYPHFAILRDFPGKGGSDGGINIVTAKNAAELEKKLSPFRENYQVIYKKDNQLYHEAMGQYQYSRNFSETRLNNELKRNGILNDVLPESNFDSTVKDYTDWHRAKETQVARDHIELMNAQQFAELNQRAVQYGAADTSKRGFLGNFLNRLPDNPYDSYRRTALALSQRDNYPMWFNAQQKVEAFFDTAFNTARNTFFAAKKNLISFDEANALTEKMGLPNAYAKAVDGIKAYTDTAYTQPEQHVLRNFISKANNIMAATHIRLDSYQLLVHALSTPILVSSEAQAAIKAAKDFISVEIPDGSGRVMPSVTKLLMNATASFVGKDADYATIMPYLKSLGKIKDVHSMAHFDMLKDLTLPRSGNVQAAMDNLSNTVDKAAKLSGAQLSEEFSKYVSGYVAHKIFTSAGQSGQELADNVATFMNRTHGNITQSQRPVAFQGPIGAALGMFMTYQTTMFQQMLRHVDEGNMRALATMLGAQGTLFGIGGLPGMQFVNQALIANNPSNPTHQDLYSVVPSWAGDKLGKWLMYGALSNATDTGLYTRGDTNPRQVTFVPVNPLDFPAISGGIKFASAIYDTAQRLSNGGAVGPSLLLGMEHNGLSRSLSGVAQIAQGFVTTPQGNQIAATRDPTQGWSDIVSWANFSRLAGARPLDEAIAQDAQFRLGVYQATDRTRQEALGAAVKTHFAGTPAEDISPEMANQFASLYARAGGRQQNYASWLHTQLQDADVSTTNRVFKANATPVMQNTQRIMGGQPLQSTTSLTQQASQQQPGVQTAGDGSQYVADPQRPGQFMKVVGK